MAGTPPTQLVKQRSLLVRAAKHKPHHVDPVVAVRLLLAGSSACDPLVRCPLGILRNWLEVLRDTPRLREVAGAAWENIVGRTTDPDDHLRVRWARVRGPAGALIATLQERGWKALGPRSYADPYGGEWDLDAEPSLHEPLLEYWERDLELGVWRNAAGGR